MVSELACLSDKRPFANVIQLLRGYTIEFFGGFKGRAYFSRMNQTATQKGISIHANGHTRKTNLFAAACKAKVMPHLAEPVSIWHVVRMHRVKFAHFCLLCAGCRYDEHRQESKGGVRVSYSWDARICVHRIPGKWA